MTDTPNEQDWLDEVLKRFARAVLVPQELSFSEDVRFARTLPETKSQITSHYKSLMEERFNQLLGTPKLGQSPYKAGSMRDRVYRSGGREASDVWRLQANEILAQLLGDKNE